jgi:hypothetical protein
MDTRRLSESIDAVQPAVPGVEPRVEIVELTAVHGPARGVLRRVGFALVIVLMAGLIAWAGLPSRTSFAFDEPLPNLLTPTAAP